MRHRRPLDHRHVVRLGKALIAVGLVVAVIFGARAVRGILGLHRSGLHPGMTDAGAIRGWMTLPHIARAYRVPPEPLFEAAGADPAADQRASIARIARDQGRSPEAVRAAVQAALVRLMRDRDSGLPPPPRDGPRDDGAEGPPGGEPERDAAAAPTPSAPAPPGRPGGTARP